MTEQRPEYAAGNALKTAPDSAKLPSRGVYVRVTHPATGRFMFEYDPQRDLVLVVDRGKEALIDLAQYKETQNA